MKIHVERRSLADYEALEPERLREAQLEENQLLHLMMRCESGPVEALRAPVFITKLRRELGRTAFGVVYTDIDLKPISKAHHSELTEHYWDPVHPLPLKSHDMDSIARTGYFMPYENDMDDELLRMTEQLTLSASR